MKTKDSISNLPRESLHKSKPVIASAAKQSIFACQSTTYGSPRRCAPRDDGLMQTVPSAARTQIKTRISISICVATLALFSFPCMAAPETGFYTGLSLGESHNKFDPEDTGKIMGPTTLKLALGISPVAAQDPEAPSTEASDLGVMGVNLKDAVKFDYGFQGTLQGAGTPNQAGIGAYIPLKFGDNSVSFLDVLVNANFSDYSGYSSIINTDVSGTTLSTSTRLGYRWLNDNRSWMFGVNAGYDSRQMATGGNDKGVPVTDSQTVFYQQVSAGLEAVSNSWNFNAYALLPVGDKEQRLNSVYLGGALKTYGLDIGYSINPQLKASFGYYHQARSKEEVDGSGVRSRLAYDLAKGLTVGANLSYDEAFKTRVSGDIQYRFGANGYGAPSISKQQPSVMPVIQALSASPINRDVRVHDTYYPLICVEFPTLDGCPPPPPPPPPRTCIWVMVPGETDNIGDTGMVSRYICTNQ